jgi:mannose-6-phosphate isomerase-like protein (cupin superfamily)
MDCNPINFKEKFSLFSEHWSPRIIAQMNEVQFKIAKIKGAFIWHSHPDTDEAFIVIEGRMQIDFRDCSVNLKQGEMIVVPKGTEHKPIAGEECYILLAEPVGTLNTGDTGEGKTIEEIEWI